VLSSSSEDRDVSHDNFTGAATYHELTAIPADQVRCVFGVHLGEPLSMGPDVCLGDGFLLPATGCDLRLSLCGPDPSDLHDVAYRLAAPFGKADIGALVEPGPVLRMMCANGGQYALRSVRVGDIDYLVPLGLLDRENRLTLISVDTDQSPLPAADPTPLGFATGTRILTEDGNQIAIEDLNPGDRVRTLEGGASEVLGVLTGTSPAVGPMARVVIHPGTLGNEDELILSAGQRVHVPGNGPDKTTRARNMVNGLTVVLDSGGQAEFHHIVLAEHQTVFAEGVPCESMLLDIPRRSGLSDDLALQVLKIAPGLYHQEHSDYAPRPEESKGRVLTFRLPTG
jgi:hypothetical protein